MKRKKAPLRASPRAILREPALRVFEDGREEAVKIIDLSETGARVEMSAQGGDKVRILWVPVAGTQPFPLEGQVVWREGPLAGVEFTPLSKKLGHLIRRLIEFHR